MEKLLEVSSSSILSGLGYVDGVTNETMFAIMVVGSFAIASLFCVGIIAILYHFGWVD